MKRNDEITSLFDKQLIQENDGFFENYCESAGLKFVDHSDLGIRGIFISQAVQAFDSHRSLDLTKKKFPNIAVGIYEDDSEIQAFASKWNDFYVIGISTGFIIQFFQVLEAPFPELQSFRKVELHEEKQLRITMFIQCCTFVVEHEFAHIFNGHLDYTNALGLEGKITEKRKTSTEPKPELTIKQVLEMDADMCAMSTILASGKIPTSLTKKGTLPDWHPLTNLKQYFSFSYLCAAIVFKILGDGNFKQELVGTSSHPLPRVRQYYLMLNLIAVNQAYDFGFDDSELEEIISKAFWDAENIVNHSKREVTNKEALTPKFFNQHPLLEEMKNVWRDTVHDDLLKYSFGPLVGKNGEATDFVTPDEEKIALIKAALDKLS